ncbi:hypothetical protein HERIO_1634 [Hepatospora eriocheir]|uniref:Uncharacterized protein n=1 Tax=Hepatospora eriocheir TaxID=1081669 RepID=A0A1X0Q9I7_9MICR|nr:hypothetical protein HERIO_1634 [Hepatospora eriocheir]
MTSFVSDCNSRLEVYNYIICENMNGNIKLYKSTNLCLKIVKSTTFNEGFSLLILLRIIETLALRIISGSKLMNYMVLI